MNAVTQDHTNQSDQPAEDQLNLLDDQPRPSVDIALPIHEKADLAWQALVDANDDRHPTVMVRGNELVRMTERGELEGFTADSLRDEISRCAQFGRTSDGGQFKPVDPPVDVARNLLERDSARYEGAPRVDGVIDVPIVGKQGALIDEPGHHDADRIFLRLSEDIAGSGLRDVRIEMVDEVAEARDLLMNDLLGDFAFADQSDKANALALLLLPFVREYLGDSPTPMHVIHAPEPGTGKTLLAQSALLPGCGPSVPMMAGDRGHNDEWRKSITAALLAGSRAVVLDNLGGALDSGPLSSALTSGLWSDRVLGHSRQVSLPIRNVWVATGNNLDLSDEQARRAVPIFLEPGDVRPADRGKAAFRHPDLMRWARGMRSALVAAALTLIRHWLQGPIELGDGGHVFFRSSDISGEPADPLRGQATLGSYERWAEVMGGILLAADVPGFLENRDRVFAEANQSGREAAQFLAAWHQLGLEPIEFQQLKERCQHGGALYDDLPTELVGLREDNLHKQLSSWLQQHHGRLHGEHRLVRHEGSGHRARNRWAVQARG